MLLSLGYVPFLGNAVDTYDTTGIVRPSAIAPAIVQGDTSDVKFSVIVVVVTHGKSWPFVVSSFTFFCPLCKKMSDVDEHAEQQKQQQQQQQQLAQEGGYYNDGGIESDAISSVSSSMSFSDAVLVSQQQHQQRQHQQGTPPKTPSPVLPATTETPTTTAATSSPSVASSSFPSTPSVANLSSSAGQVQIMLPSYEEAMPWKTTTKPRRIVGSKPDEYLNVLVAGEAGLGI